MSVKNPLLEPSGTVQDDSEPSRTVLPLIGGTVGSQDGSRRQVTGARQPEVEPDS
jgi:hypothetical protein